MTCNGLWECITPEQWALLIATITGVMVAFFGAIAYLIKWGVDYFARVQEVKLKAMQQDIDNNKAELDSQRKIDELKVQKQLDETHSHQERERMFFSELAESRKEDAAIRASYDRREAAHIEFMNSIASAMRGIEISINTGNSNMSLALELLKKGQERDEIMEIKQEKIIAQNDKTSEKLDAVIAELKTVSVGRASDRIILEDVQKKLLEIADDIKHLRDKPAILQNVVSSEIEDNEQSKEDKSP